MIDSNYFQKVKSFLSISQCVQLSPEMSQYSIGCGIDIIVEITSVVSFIDYRFGQDGQVVSIGQADVEQMKEISDLTAPLMLTKINEIMTALPL